MERKESGKGRGCEEHAPGRDDKPALSASRTRAFLCAAKSMHSVVRVSRPTSSSTCVQKGRSENGWGERLTKPRRYCAATLFSLHQAASCSRGSHLRISQCFDSAFDSLPFFWYAEDERGLTDFIFGVSLEREDVGRVGARVGGGFQSGDAGLPGFSEGLCKITRRRRGQLGKAPRATEGDEGLTSSLRRGVVPSTGVIVESSQRPIVSTRTLLSRTEFGLREFVTMSAD